MRKRTKRAERVTFDPGSRSLPEMVESLRKAAINFTKKDAKEEKMIDVFDNDGKTTTNYDLDPESFGGEDYPSNPSDGVYPMGCSGAIGPTGPTGAAGQESVKVYRSMATGPVKVYRSMTTGPQGPTNFPPLVTAEEERAIKKLYDEKPWLKVKPKSESVFTKGEYKFSAQDPWIQTYSGRRFCPTNPNPEAVVIQDISHSLSMQCRFSGHVKKFYSVAQHSVLVSYICDHEDALWGLMHDASEAYLVDVPRPLKRSGKFDAYLEFEKTMQEAICKRFGLPEKEPPSVKWADTILLATEARDLMSPLHPDWVQAVDPLPFKIEPLPPQEAKNLFMKRFFELFGMPGGYEHYLQYENNA